MKKGNEVVAIDTDKARVHAIDPYSSEAIVMDASDKEALSALGLESMDGVIVSTGTKISKVSLYAFIYMKWVLRISLQRQLMKIMGRY